MLKGLLDRQGTGVEVDESSGSENNIKGQEQKLSYICIHYTLQCI
jgi:hypothetical protein